MTVVLFRARMIFFLDNNITIYKVKVINSKTS